MTESSSSSSAQMELRSVKREHDLQRISPPQRCQKERRRTSSPMRDRREASITPPPYMSELRIVLVGKTGSGKSASANTILRKQAFEVDFSPESVTRKCQYDSAEVDGRLVKVVDTPGLFDTTSKSKVKLKSEVERCVDMSVPGPHAFLLVIRMGRFTGEEKDTVKWIQENFGQRASKYTIVLFTGGDQLKGRLEDTYLCKSSDLVSLTRSCGGGYHVFNNDKTKDRTQVRMLFEKIETLVKKNGGEYYTNQMYQEAQAKIREEEERKRQEEERKQQEIFKQIETEKNEKDRMIRIMEEETKREKKKRIEYEAKAEEERRKAEEERRKRETSEQDRKKLKLQAVEERHKRRVSDKKRKKSEIALAERMKQHSTLQTKVALAGGIAGASLATGGLAVAGAGVAVAAVGGAAIGSTAAALTYKLSEGPDPLELLRKMDEHETEDPDEGPSK